MFYSFITQLVLVHTLKFITNNAIKMRISRSRFSLIIIFLTFFMYSMIFLILNNLEYLNLKPVSISEIMSGKVPGVKQDDQRIIDYIWSNNLILPPSPEPYMLKAPDTDPSAGQGQYIRKLLNNMRMGFFVECGALDGELASNTLYMEMKQSWRGLLIEADPKNFALAQKKQRSAWMSNTCLSIHPYPHTARFHQEFDLGKIVDENNTSNKEESLIEIQCIPLFSLLTALNVDTVDYFSLDVEGYELQVLKTIPFDKVFIRTLSVEYTLTIEGKDELLQFMESQGYRLVGEVSNHKVVDDFIFVHMNITLDEFL